MTLEWESQGLVDECTARNLEDAIQMTDQLRKYRRPLWFCRKHLKSISPS
jgi:hypothetical protein